MLEYFISKTDENGIMVDEIRYKVADSTHTVAKFYIHEAAVFCLAMLVGREQAIQEKIAAQKAARIGNQ